MWPASSIPAASWVVPTKNLSTVSVATIFVVEHGAGGGDGDGGGIACCAARPADFATHHTRVPAPVGPVHADR